MPRLQTALQALQVLSMGAFVTISALAQDKPPPAGMPQYQPQGIGLQPNSDRDAESWLAKAEGAAAQQDWKLAADTLMRVIEQSGDKTVSTDGGRHFTSALRSAQNQLAAWPEAGLTAYRLLYDPEAKQRYDRAVQEHNLEELRTLARTYTFTSVGPDAMNLLATWLLDLQAPSEAIDLLDDLLHLPGRRIPTSQIHERLVLAYTLADESEAASHHLELLQKTLDAEGALASQDVIQRLESLRRFAGRARHSATTSAPSGRGVDWPVMLGSAARAGRMASIQPAVAAETTLSAPLPGARPSLTASIAKLIEKTGRPPVWQAVSDGRALFLTSPDGLIARDLGTFEFLWQAVPKSLRRDPSIDRFRLRTGTNEADNEGRLDEYSTRAIWHEYRGAVSTALDLVFIIEQHGTHNEQFPTKAGVPAPNNAFFGEELAEPNSLRAYESDTGRVAWTKGRGGPVEDELRQAHFFAPPVLAGGRLISPFQIGNDLYLGVMDRQGKLLRRVLLGTGQPGVFPMNGVLLPTVHENSIYLQTGAGLFMVLNAHDFSLRWLAAYDRCETTTSRQAPARIWAINGVATGGLAQPDEWAGSPAIIAGGLIIVAPHDSDSLLAFDRRRGEAKWTYPRGAHRYIVGADDNRVFIAGKSILALDLATGKSAWAYRKSKLAGRPALCGNQIFFPTAEGIVCLNAQTGEVMGKPLSADRPMGNLIALDGALYSITSDAVSKFPDIDQSREIALARLRENPADLRATLRLAGLESVRGEWKKALDLLEKAQQQFDHPAGATATAPEDARSEDREDLRNRINHQKFAALLNLAVESDPAQRRGYLEQACAAAKKPADVLRAELTLTDFLTGLRHDDSSAGVANHVAAFRRLISLVQRFGEEPVTVSDDHRASAGVRIADRMRRLWTGLPDSARSELASDLVSAIKKPSQSAEGSALTRLADALDFHEAGARFDLAIARDHLSHGDPESAAFFLQRAARRGAQYNAGAVQREAQIRLARASIGLEGPLSGSPTEAARILRVLEREDSSAPMPEGIPVIERQSPAKTLGEFVAQVRSVLPKGLREPARAMPEILRGTPRLRAIGDDAVIATLADVRSYYDPSTRIDLFSEIIPLRILRHIKGYPLNSDANASVSWACELDSNLEDYAPATERGVEIKAYDAVFAGRIGIFDAESQIMAVGLASGRALWPAISFDPQGRPPPNPIGVHSDGIVFLAPDDATLLAIPARTNARPIWTRTFSNMQLGVLNIVDGRLALIDRASTVALLIDPASGRTLKRTSLNDSPTSAPDNSEQKQEGPGTAPETWFGLFGKTACRGVEHHLVGRDLMTGEVLWRRTLPGRIQSMHRLNDHHLGVTYLNQHLEVIHAASGRVIKTVSNDDLVIPPIDVVFDVAESTTEDATGRLLLFCKTKTKPPHFVLHSYPIAMTGNTWQRDLGIGVAISQQMMRASPDFIAVVRYEFTDTEEAAGSPGPSGDLESVQLVILDKKSNNWLLDEPFTFAGRVMRDNLRTRTIKDVIVFDQRIVAVAPEGCYFLARSEDEQPARGSGNDAHD